LIRYLAKLQTLQSLQSGQRFESMGQKKAPEGAVLNALVGTGFNFSEAYTEAGF